MKGLEIDFNSLHVQFIFVNHEEEKLLWGISTNIKKLKQWYRQVLKHDLDDPETIELVKKEIKLLEEIFDYIDSVLNDSGNINRDKVKKLLKEESQAEDISVKLEQKFKEDGLEMAGNRGLEYIKSLEELTEGFVSYESIKSIREQNTENGPRAVKEVSTSSARYLLTFQQHSKMAKMTDRMYQESDAIVIENASPHRLQNQPCVNTEIPDTDIENPFQSIMFRNIIEDQKPVYTVDLSLKGQKGPFEHGETNETMEYVRINIHEKGGPVAYITAAFGSSAMNLALGSSAFLTLGFVTVGIALTMVIAKSLHEYEIDLDTSKLRLLEFFNPSVMRSAVIAEKLDEYLGPKIREERGREPLIYLNYGLGHQDIKMFLEKPELRKFIINLHETVNFPTMEESSAGLITEFTFGSDKQDYVETTYRGKHTETYYDKSTIETGLFT